MNLNEVGIKHSTDQSSLYHHYLQLFEFLFGYHRYHPIRILEIGVQFGHSLKTWREYFGYATVIGIDSVDNSAMFNPKPKDGFTLKIMDAYCDAAIEWLGKEKFDVMIDDGSHIPFHQEWFVKNYCQLLTDNGLIIVEDVLKPETIQLLVKALPTGFSYAAVDMTEGRSTVDSRLFIARRKS